MKKTTILSTIIILFGILFLYAGISKLIAYSSFKEQIATSPLLESIADYIAQGLPIIEFMVVLLLFIPRWRLKGLYSSLILMLLFTGYIIAILTFSNNIPCSCGGLLELLSLKEHIVFNSLFIALAITGAILEKQLKKERKTHWNKEEVREFILSAK